MVQNWRFVGWKHSLVEGWEEHEIVRWDQEPGRLARVQDHPPSSFTQHK